MPIYEYRCRDCGFEFETMTTMAKANEVSCKACQSDKTDRKFSVFGVSVAGPKNACAVGESPRSCGAASPGGCGACPGMMG